MCNANSILVQDDFRRTCTSVDMCECAFAAKRETVEEFVEYIILNCDVDVLLILFAQLVFRVSAK